MIQYVNQSLLSLPAPMLVGFFLVLALMPPYINYLKARSIGQFIRSDGPKQHAVKAKTPTMGGAVFILVSFVTSLWWLYFCHQISVDCLSVLFVALGCGAIGMTDDLAKILHRDNRGISGKVRLLLEALLGIGLAFALLLSHNALVGTPPAAVVLYVLFAGFLVAGAANAVNLHDGMDGLAAGTSCQVLATLAFLLYLQSSFALAGIAAAAAGGVAGFFLFNRNPARIFMGDTGSLFLGGLMAALALAGNLVIWFIPISLIYIVETLSVMAQVVYFKLTKPYTPAQPMSTVNHVWTKLTKRLPGEGKRLLRMAPLHHHFESVGQEFLLAEWQVVALFHLAQFVLCILTIAIFIFGRR